MIFSLASTISVLEYVLGGLLLLLTLVLVFVILKQSSGESGISGTITGSAADTFYGKNKGKSRDRLLAKITIVLSIVIVVITVALLIFIAKS